MKILIAPSESKVSGGEFPPIDLSKFPVQKEVLLAYEEFIKNSSIELLSKWFNLKDLNLVKEYKKLNLTSPTLKAIQRYSGVAFEAIDYKNLNKKAKNYLDENLIIFSNLFGAIKANCLIPNYKFKQGAILPNLNQEKYYKKNLKDYLDNLLDDEIIDLRAKYYDKYYKVIKQKVITFKFIKNGKVISHWAKHFRGLIVKELAINNINSFDELKKIQFPNLKLIEIQQKKNIQIFIMEIL